MLKIQSIINNIRFKNIEIKHISNPKLKHSYISVDKESNVVLKTPKVSDKFIDKLLLEKESWIKRKIKHTESNPPLVLSVSDIDTNSSKEHLESRIDFFAKEMQLKYSELKFRKMKSRWGSCNSKGVITLNKKLAKTPSICIDYVVVHELSHLVYMNHSPKFHKLVDKYFNHSVEAKEILSRIVFK